MTKTAQLRTAGIAATIAGLLGGMGDLLLFYTPGFATDLFAVHTLPDWRILSGTLLAISMIPLLSLGYWAFSRHLRGISEGFANAIFIGGMYGAGIGNAIHGMMGILVQVVQHNGIATQSADFVALYARFVVPLYALFYLLMTAGTIILAIVIWRGKTLFPRWFIFLLPLWSNVLVVLLGQLVPGLADLLVPSIANLSHALMFGVMTALFWDQGT